MNPKSVYWSLSLLCLCTFNACAPHVRPISTTALHRLQQHSTPHRANEFSKGQLRLEYPVQLTPGTILQVPLRETHQIPTISVALDSCVLPWIVVTGAAFAVLLDSDSAARARLPVIEGAKVKGIGVGGNTDVLLGRFESLDCAGKKVLGAGIAGVLLQTYHVKFAGLPMRRMPINLLGLPFLKLFTFVTLDAPAKEAHLGYKTSFLPPKGAVSFPFQIQDGHLWVNVNIAGQSVRAFFDTGCGSSLRLPASALANLPPSAWTSSNRKKREAMGVGGVEMEEIGTLKEAFVGKVRITPVEYDTSAVCRDAMLGWGPFRNNRITLDFQRNCVWVEPVAGTSL